MSDAPGVLPMSSLYWVTPVTPLHVKVVEAPVKTLPLTGVIMPVACCTWVGVILRMVLLLVSAT